MTELLGTLTWPRVVQLLVRFELRVLKHFLFRPYGPDMPEIGYIKTEHLTPSQRIGYAHGAAGGELMLLGYSEITNRPLRPKSGIILHFFSIITNIFDALFERNLREGDSLDWKAILQHPALAQYMTWFGRFLDLYGQREAVLGHFEAYMVSGYAQHVANVSKGLNLSYDEVLRQVEFDSGRYIQLVIEMVALFNDHPLDPAVGSQYYCLGMIIKHADDLADIEYDFHSQSPNLMLALIKEFPEEAGVVLESVRMSARRDRRWWSDHAPQVFGIYMERIAQYYRCIGSRHLQTLCDLLLVPTIVLKLRGGLYQIRAE